MTTQNNNTNIIWDVRTIMTAAWKRAHKRAAKHGLDLRKTFAKCLKVEWNIAHDQAEALEISIINAARDALIAVADAKRDAGRYVELVSVALKNGLNSGACWEATEANAKKFDLDSSWIGQTICYVYA